MNLLKILSLILAATLIAAPLHAAALAQYDFGIVALPTRMSSDTDLTTTASTFDDGAGFAGLSAFNTTTGNPAPSLAISAHDTPANQANAISGNAYYTFTITPMTGFKFSLTSLTFDRAILGSSITASFFVRSSADNFAIDIAPVNTTSSTTFTNTSISLAGAAYQNLTTPLTFRLYIFDGDNGSSKFDLVDNVILNGAAIPIPEPSTYILLGMGLLLGMQSFRRKKN